MSYRSNLTHDAWRIGNRVSAIFITLMLAACGSGVETNQLSAPAAAVNGPTYVGPAPATAEAQSYMVNVWDNLRSENRCGTCHSDSGGQTPMFVRTDDINLAYAAAVPRMDAVIAANSRFVSKVLSPPNGHHCWLGSPQACADILTTWISAWSGTGGGGGGRQIQLTAPVHQNPGDSRNFPLDSTAFAAAGGIHELLIQYDCGDCHRAASNSSETPFFAEPDPILAYEAAKQKIDLDDPPNSRFVVRLRDQSHNCPNICSSDAAEMLSRIQAYAGAIQPTGVDAPFTSMALALYDGTVASGGNRYEANQIAFYEFKEGPGAPITHDTSGVDPAMDLTLSGSVDLIGGWGIDFINGKAQASTVTSKKLHDLIKAAGEYSVEAWVVPGNVTQEDTRIISYSAGRSTRNFTLGQTLYNYDFLNRSGVTDANGSPALSTADADEDLQATLQHVVMTYDPINGRRIFVNGVFTDDADSGGDTLAAWDDTFAFVLGNEVSSDMEWQGVLRMVAIHNRVLTPEQIEQNFDVGVGEKFFLLFYIGDLIPMADAYIMFEVSQFDSYGYLFKQPTLISLDPLATPGDVPLQGMRIGINGDEAIVGQAYANLDVTLADSNYDPATGLRLSDLGTIISLESGPANDEFFLTFERLGVHINAFTQPVPLAPLPVDGIPAPDIGIRTFDEINETMSAVTLIPTDEPAVHATFTTIRQQLPSIESIETFAASHEIAIAQLAIEYCFALVENTSRRDAYFLGFDFTAGPATAFAGTSRDAVINPLINNVMGIGLGSQPLFTDVSNELGYIVTPDYTNLIDTMIASGSNTPQRTSDITKAVCASVLGSAVMLIQ